LRDGADTMSSCAIPCLVDVDWFQRDISVGMLLFRNEINWDSWRNFIHRLQGHVDRVFD